jgi:hypothetical protein
VRNHPLSVGLACLAALALAMFADVLAPGTRVLGHASTDLFRQFLPWREFGFRELAAGNVALWNPHIFGGAPYHGGMQAALFYPLNWLFLVLPTAQAVNWTIALNVWLLGAFTYLWALRRELQPLAAFAGAALLMFCAPFFFHIYAGHLANIAAMAWVPLVLLAVDEWLRTRRPAWCLVGMLAVCMQILAGHPQYVYFTAVAATVYSLLRLAGGYPEALRAAAGLGAFCAGGVALAAVQFFPGVQAAGETVREQALPYALASTFAFPPENLLTLVAPAFFGDARTLPYWGRWYIWEMSLFIGVTGFALAAYGMARGQLAGKRAMLAAVVLMFVLALGKNTPLFGLLYDYAPGFDRFRSLSKFTFFCAVFLALFAAAGLDRILRAGGLERRALQAGVSAAVLLCAAAVAVRWLDWQPVMQAVLARGESYLDPRAYRDAGFVAGARAMASGGLLLAGITLGAACLLAARVQAWRFAALALTLLAIAEVMVVARASRATFDSTLVTAGLPKAVSGQAGEHRVINLFNPNSAMATGGFDVWGYDPGVTRRYAELIEWSEGGDPAKATQYAEFRNFHPLLSMLRARYVVFRDGDGVHVREARSAPLRRLELLGAHRAVADRAAALRALGDPAFDPRREVVLERQPDPVPAPAPAPGQAKVVGEGTDYLEIEAHLRSPAVLLVTDAWTPSWQARALEGSTQARYEVMPANYALRGIPLAAGTHRLRLEYSPRYFLLGAWVSALAWLLWSAGLVYILRRRHA